jgi:peptidoglycan/xylan/chitin deacetylase (PgdA/CDA1 family)
MAPPRYRQLVRATLATTLPRRLLLVRGPAAGGSVCLTFDDGPHPENTPAVLDVLKKEGVSATFFVIGQRAQRYPRLVRRMAAEGHLIGHHSFSHAEPGRTTARQLLEEVGRTQELLARLVGRPSPWFRPPKGKVTARKLWRLWRAGQRVVLWNVDPKDYACRSAAEVRAWFARRPLEGGDVVLLHDSHPHAAGVLPELIHAARRRGLNFVTPARWVS